MATDLRVFVAEFARLLVVYERGLTETQTEMMTQAYFDALADYEIDEIRDAMRASLTLYDFRPKPSQLVALMNAARLQRQREDWARQRDALEGDRRMALRAGELALTDEQRAENLQRVRDLIADVSVKTTRALAPKPPDDDELQAHVERQRKAWADAQRFWARTGDEVSDAGPE